MIIVLHKAKDQVCFVTIGEKTFYSVHEYKVRRIYPLLKVFVYIDWKSETQLCIAQIGRISIFEVTTTWICLKLCHIQDQRIEIRETG